MHLRRQIFITESCYWLTGPIKTAKNAHNSGSCAWRELAAAAWVLPFRGENAGHAAPALILSLRHSPLVNSVASRLTVTTPGGTEPEAHAKCGAALCAGEPGRPPIGDAKEWQANFCSTKPSSKCTASEPAAAGLLSRQTNR